MDLRGTRSLPDLVAHESAGAKHTQRIPTRPGQDPPSSGRWGAAAACPSGQGHTPGQHQLSRQGAAAGGVQPKMKEQIKGTLAKDEIL